jgi:hypothetical protein
VGGDTVPVGPYLLGGKYEKRKEKRGRNVEENKRKENIASKLTLKW